MAGAPATGKPGAHRVKGPHGIPLMAHAKRGGPEAEAVVKFLEELEKTSS